MAKREIPPIDSQYAPDYCCVHAGKYTWQRTCPDLWIASRN